MENGHLAKVDLTKKIESKSKYNKKLEKYQRRLLALQQILKRRKNRGYACYGRMGCGW